MPRYYFAFREGDALSLDDQGLELDSLESAYLQAFRAAQEMWGDRVLTRRDPLICAFEISDQSGTHLLTLPFSEVLDSCRGKGTQRDLGRSGITDALERTMRMRRLTQELSHQLQNTEAAIRRAREIVGRSKRTSRHRWEHAAEAKESL
jgi:hypothetical protein